jgi:hypothetical protein
MAGAQKTKETKTKGKGGKGKEIQESNPINQHGMAR